MQKRTLLKCLSLLTAFPAVGRTAPQSRTAVVYFSKTGSTQSVAEAVQAMIGAELFRIETVEPYPEAYRPTTEIVRDEIARGVKRPLRPLSVDLSAFDTVILAGPTWWHYVPQPLKTWIETADLRGKKVLTCNSHGGGGLMHTREDFEAVLAGKDVKLGTHFTTYGGVMTQSPAVAAWLRENGLLK